MNLNELLKIKNKLKEFISRKDVSDVILFGSFTKGKSEYKDIDVLILTKEKFNKEIAGFHLNFMSPEELFTRFPMMMNTILKEGYSLKHNRALSEYFRFNSKVLFSYSLKNLSLSEKVKVVNLLRGTKKNKGLVEENNGLWIANNVFKINQEKSNLLEKLFLNFKIKFSRSNILTD